MHLEYCRDVKSFEEEENLLMPTCFLVMYFLMHYQEDTQSFKAQNNIHSIQKHKCQYTTVLSVVTSFLILCFHMIIVILFLSENK
jgi:large-conductance mechanosensitive channel